MKTTTLLSSVLLLVGCTQTPQGIRPVDNFQLERYLGTWYEIARLDHSFERGLSHVTATYQKRQDGGIDVINRGYNPQTGQWQEARGRAYPLGPSAQGSLKVTFFWPFYAGYHVIALEQENYSDALVCGPDRDYLWILARSPQLSATRVEALVTEAQRLGFATQELIFVDQSQPPPPQDITER